MLRSLYRRVVVLMCCVSFLSVVSVPASAGIVSNQQMINSWEGAVTQSQLLSLLDRDEVARKLESMGVDRQQVEARIQVMTPAELAEFNQRLDQAQAGGDIIGIVVLFLIIFIITDIIGATDIFTFIHPVR